MNICKLSLQNWFGSTTKPMSQNQTWVGRISSSLNEAAAAVSRIPSLQATVANNII